MSNSTKISLIIASLLTGLGVIVFVITMSVYGWNFNKLDNKKYNLNTYEISNDFNNVKIDTETADITILPSLDGKCKVECYEQEKVTHTVTTENDALVINVSDNRSWLDNLFNFKSQKVTVYLPKIEYSSISIKEVTGNVNISKNLNFNNISVSVTTGDVKNYATVSETANVETTTGDIIFENITTNNLKISTTTGNVTLKGVSCLENIDISVTSGDIEIENVTCKNFESNGTTGEAELYNLIAVNGLKVERVSGDVTFEKIEATQIIIQTNTGDIEGSILTGKEFKVKTDTGDVKIPSSVTGSGVCKIETNTGDIKITIK